MSANEMVTFRRADGESIGDYSWVTELDWFDDDDEPTELVEERWVLAESRTFVQKPAALYECRVDWCDEDAIEWTQQEDGSWGQFCAKHLADREAD